MHLLLPCCHDVKYIKNKFLCSNWFSNTFTFWNIPTITTKKRFDSLGQDLVHLINLSFYCKISRSTLQFICYTLLAFFMWSCTSSFSSKYLLLQTEILTSDITTFQPYILPVYLNISINQVISILTFINYFLFSVSPDECVK